MCVALPMSMVLGTPNVRGPSDVRGPRDVRGPPDVYGPTNVRDPPDVHGPSDVRGPPGVHGSMQQSHDLQACVQFQGTDWIIYRVNIDIAIELLFNIIELELNSNLVFCSRPSVFLMLTSSHGVGCSGLEPSFCMSWPGTEFFCHMTDLSCQSQSQYVIRAVWFGHGRWDTVVSSFRSLTEIK